MKPELYNALITENGALTKLTHGDAIIWNEKEETLLVQRRPGSNQELKWGFSLLTKQRAQGFYHLGQWASSEDVHVLMNIIAAVTGLNFEMVPVGGDGAMFLFKDRPSAPEASATAPTEPPPAAAPSYEEQVDAFGRQLIQSALYECKGDLEQVSAKLNIPARILRQVMDRFDNPSDGPQSRCRAG